MPIEADRIEAAVQKVLSQGLRTVDIFTDGTKKLIVMANTKIPLVGLVGWRGMVGSVLLERMLAEKDFELIEPVFFSTSQAGGVVPLLNGQQ
eukprot:gene15474-18908_t